MSVQFTLKVILKPLDIGSGKSVTAEITGILLSTTSNIPDTDSEQDTSSSQRKI